MSCGAIWYAPHFLMGRKSVLKAPIKTTQVHGIDDRGRFRAHLKNFVKHYGGLRQTLFNSIYYFDVVEFFDGLSTLNNA